MLSFAEPFAIREVAREMGKSPAAVGAHVAKLVEVGLVIQVGTRKRRSRIESLYAHRAKSANFSFVDQPWEYTEKYLARFRGAMRSIERQHEMFQRAVRVDPSFIPFGSYNWRTVWLNREQRIAYAERLRALRTEMLEASETDPAVREKGEYVRLVLSMTFFPTVVESKKRMASGRDSERDVN